MQQSQEMTSEEKAGLSDAVDESLGNPGESVENNSESSEQNDLPEYAKKKLGMQEKRHKKEIRRMQSQIDEMNSRFGSRPEPQNSHEHNMNPYNSQHEEGNNNDQIYAAVNKALQMQKEQEHKAREAERMQHVNKQYRALKDHLDNHSDKYDDFDEVVNSDDAPYTTHMRDASLLIPNAAETLYHLGKDRDKLKKISELHPLDQAKEVVKMSIALMGGTGKNGSSSSVKPLSNIRNNPINSAGVNESTSIGEIRKRLKSGDKKWS